MKFCQNCGSGCKAANGQPAKFCGECGESLGGAAKSIAGEIPTVVVGDFDEITSENMFTVYRNESQSMDFETLAEDKSVSSKTKRAKGNTTLKSIRANAKKNIQIDA